MAIKTPDLLKRALHNEHSIRMMANLLERILSLWMGSCQYYVHNENIIKDIEDSGKQVLVTTWHCGLLPVLYALRNHKAAVMVSASKDGEWIKHVIEKWGFVAVRGSSGRGGRIATRRMLNFLSQGFHGGLIADGSRGPARKAQKGVVFISNISGIPILPMGVGIHPSICLPTWDRMICPLPYSRVVITIGPFIKRVQTKTNRNEDATTLLSSILDYLYDFAHYLARTSPFKPS